MIINNSHRFIFIHVPKNAGTSIANYYSALTRANDVEVGGTALGEAVLPEFIKRHQLGKHAPLRRVRHKLAHVQDIDSYFAFMFVRNPYERTLSTFSFLKKWLPTSHANVAAEAFDGIQNVNEMLQSAFWQTSDIDNLFKPQTFWATDPEGEVIIDFWGKVENISADVQRLNHQLGVELPPFETRMNESVDETAPQSLNEASIAIIQERYAGDFELFDYPLAPASALGIPASA